MPVPKRGSDPAGSFIQLEVVVGVHTIMYEIDPDRSTAQLKSTDPPYITCCLFSKISANMAVKEYKAQMLLISLLI
jgi:hypothetical protein